MKKILEIRIGEKTVFYKTLYSRSLKNGLLSGSISLFINIENIKSKYYENIYNGYCLACDNLFKMGNANRFNISCPICGKKHNKKNIRFGNESKKTLPHSILFTIYAYKNKIVLPCATLFLIWTMQIQSTFSEKVLYRK